MPYVDKVKNKHHFVQSLRDFLRYLDVMTIEELELAMAYIADENVKELNEAEKLNGLTKGTIIYNFLELRSSAKITQKKLKRAMFHGEMKRFFENHGIEEYKADVAEREARLKILRHDWNLAMVDYQKAYSEWEHERSKLPFLKRIFYSVPPPNRIVTPALPYLLDLSIYIKKAKKKGTQEEFLVGVVRKFVLLSIPDKPMEFSLKEIVALSQ